MSVYEEFSGKNVIVTGGTKGIGERVALDFISEGARVYVAYYHDTNAAQNLVDRMREKIVVKRCDVSNLSSVSRFVAEIEGNIDILVCCAGITRDKTLLKMPDESWHEVLSTNLNGAYNFMRTVIPSMINNRQGRIISISSVVGKTGNIGQCNYAASKAGLIGLTKSLALECAKYQITVNCVCPGFIETEMTARIPDDIKKKIIDRIPLGHMGQTKDVSDLVMYLSSMKARYITGQSFDINGGYYM